MVSLMLFLLVAYTMGKKLFGNDDPDRFINQGEILDQAAFNPAFPAIQYQSSFEASLTRQPLQLPLPTN